MTVDGFGAAIWKKCAQSQGFGLSVSGTGGKWGIPYGGGGGVGEPRPRTMIISMRELVMFCFVSLPMDPLTSTDLGFGTKARELLHL